MKTSSYRGLISLGVVGGALAVGPSLGAGDVAPSTADEPVASALAGAADYIGLDADAEPLRGSFNADLGTVRILMLVAPT
jgi:hypothetical protein